LGEWALAIQHRSSFTPKFLSRSASLSDAEGYVARDEPRDHQKILSDLLGKGQTSVDHGHGSRFVTSFDL
jgi:hypothetical protein